MILHSKHLRNILLNKDVCCLCLERAGEDYWEIDDEIWLDGGSENGVELSDVISTVFASIFPDMPFASRLVCNECVQATLSAYKFLWKCTARGTNMINLLNNLETTLDNVKEQIVERAKTMYVATDLDSLQSKIFYSSQRPEFIKTKPLVTKKFEAILNNTVHHESDVEKLPSFFENISEKCNMCFTVCPNKISLKAHQESNCRLPDELADSHFDDGHDMDEEALYEDVKPTGKIRNRKKQILSTEKCEFCGVICKHRYSLRYHMINNCKVLKEMYPEKSNVKHGFSSNLKDLVDTKLKMKFKLNLHPNRSSLCLACGKMVSDIEKHEQSSHKDPFECKKCNRKFKTVTAFNRHSLIPNCKETPRGVPGPKRYVCDICGKQYSSKVTIATHIHARHSDVGYQCKLCNKRLCSKFVLATHMQQVHSKEKNFECKICGGKFVTKHSLLYHTRRHTGEKPYKCEHCSRSFLSSSRRNMHYRIHHWAPQLKCPLCEKMFRLWSALNRHKKRHYNPESSLFIGDEMEIEVNENAPNTESVNNNN